MSVQTGRRPSTGEAQQATRRRRLLWSNPSPQRKQMSGAIVFVIVAGLVAAVGMLYLLQTNHVARLGYEMSSLQEERQAAMLEQQQLQAELARLQAFNRVDRAARQDLGLVPMEEYIFLDVQAPEMAELEVPADPEPESRSIWDRFWDRVTGRSTHESEPEQEVAP